MRFFNENLHATRKRLIVELIKGKETAIQLQTHLHKPVKDDGSISAEQLAMKILRSFTDTISMVSSCTPSAQISTVDGDGSACSGDRKKKPGVKDRRGCYKRKRTSDSWITVSPTMVDGCAWRKYGQKDILNSEYPRCYYRCTHKYQGCKATKQVQKMKEDPLLYQTTYFNHHTCTSTLMVPQLIVESDPMESNLISFQANNIPLKQEHFTNPMIISAAEQESKKDTQTDAISCAKSSLDHSTSRQAVFGAESLEHKSVWSPRMISYDDQEEEVSGLYSCVSTSLHELDMEVSQLDDIYDSFHFDDMH